ncbi:Triose-phosphate Transporter [Scheffersomyces spartinae]|uniref:Triose-phosphate Transporter n=1 Tax=Scheffersomyces spartinae TaxID=45513 RepID=A0A9P7V5Q1_9ASCO|nr:Triose-phosphate Transporter [Scheffersomyces spartinae]KAG7191655.1 Triose-phosphate Transporter [Scheffersomyces spartinae]
MLKTSLLIFVLLFGLLFKLERFNWKLVIIIAIMTFSVSLMVIKPDPLKNGADEVDDAKSQADVTFGIILILIASMSSGLRWSFTQLLLKVNPNTSNPIQAMFYLSPLMATLLFITGFTFEGIGKFFSHAIWQEKGYALTTILMIFPGIMAFMMTWCEFMLLQVAPLITLSIAGIFKELVTIVIGFLVFGDHLSSINVVGLFITLADIGWYNYYRHLERLDRQQQAKTKSYELNEL